MPDFYTDAPVPGIAGPPEYEAPISGDPVQYVYTVPYWVTAGSAEPAFGTNGPFGGGYVGPVGRAHPIGGGIVEVRRQFSLVPNQRDEWESFSYPYHLTFVTVFGPNACVEPFALTVNTRVHYDYFFTTDPGSIPLPRAMTIQQTCIGLLLVHGDLRTVQPNQEILAEDALLKRWKGNIYERKQRYVKWMSFWSLIAP